MIFTALDNTIDWSCNTTWRQSAYNTMWCLIGCSIGDMGQSITFKSMKFRGALFQLCY